MIYYKEYQSPLGLITIAADETALKGVWFEGQKYYAGSIKCEMIKNTELPLLNLVQIRLEKYFAGENPKFNDLPLSLSGGDFRQLVWKFLCEIPYGQTVTYGLIAKKVAAEMNLKTMSAQAIGNAVGHNPISIIIPCHRVVGANGSLTGYAGGISRKQKLLEIEGVDINSFNFSNCKSQF